MTESEKVNQKPKKPIIIKRLSDQVEQELMSMIQSGEYRPGDCLPSERELMDLFGVGRSSIREALFSVQRKGFLKINRGDKPRVIEPKPEKMIPEFTDVIRMVLSKPNGVLHFNQVRSFFEASVARFAAENATPDDISRIKAALAANRKAVSDFDSFRETDIAFHRAIAEAAHNPIVSGVFDALVEWVITKRSTPTNLEERNRSSIAGHERILECITNRNTTEAYRAMAKHIERANSEYDLLS
ncbi:MAG TPA: transcriptional regulator NanR [Rhodobacteraceae bacterium]|jgi:DNA-binding FadR family transcriptional regulator|nr:transcriptional regulator NanR [Paracoccaceae bacterium]